MIADDKLVFLGGAPRSGTTWLQLLLYNTGIFASGQETHLFSGYLKSMQNCWRLYQEGGRGRSDMGIAAYMTWDELLGHAHAFSDQVLERMWSSMPEAPYLLEKTPSHILFTDFIWQLYPRARFINLVRDPRPVVASLVAASETWGQKWATGKTMPNFQIWKQHVAAGRAVETDPRCLTLRYEDLLQDTHGCLVRISDHLRLELASDRIAEAIAACQLDNLQQGAANAPWDLTKDPKNFYRKASTDSWQTELSLADIRAIETRAAKEMEYYGYQPFEPEEG